ncbi:hypothetical protein Dsin_031324 [Dipteronia sinensis]|uniref:Zinc finger PMZ-type domain-containing protein n=1 Tax=Dipteronia sinensis TaxID=43782 RepID=A0AAE0DS32_9ROSI|nr:hypothetical protein Dsin_031324 [Dipteronia sinensis]
MIVSDRHISISNGMRAKSIDAAHRVYAYHLAKNLKQHCRKRGDVINLYYRATYVYRVEEFDHLMDELKAMYPKVYDELLEVGIHKFSLVHSPRKRDLLQHWFHDRQSNARETSTFLTPDADQHIKDRVLPSQRCEIHPIDFNRFKVDDKWNEAIIDLEQRSCSYREWVLDKLPCIHAMAVAMYAHQRIMFRLFHNWMAETGLAMAVNPVLKPEVWDITDDVRNLVVLPWKKKRLAGRPKKDRTPSVGKKQKQQTCRNCGQK